MEQSHWPKYCCNPYKKQNHCRVSKDLRNVTDWMCALNYDIQMGMKVCTSCRKQLGKEKTISQHVPALGQGAVQDDGDYVNTDEALSHLNASLSFLGESPVDKKKVRKSTKYSKEKLEKIKRNYKDAFFSGDSADNHVECQCSKTESEVISQLKDKFINANHVEKIEILTVLPQSWSTKRIENEFGVTNYLARKVKALVKEKGILSCPNPKPGKSLSEDTVNIVREFYFSDEVSRQMPGKKDCVSVKRRDGTKALEQKRLVLANLKEIYELFKTKFPNQKIGFSKFAELRPKNCVIAGGSGTHSVCVCIIHQNVKLMIAGANLEKISLGGDDVPLKNYQHCLSKIMCSSPEIKCWLDECDLCPSVSDFAATLLECLEEEMIEDITYKQWLSVDRCTFETIIKSTGDFVEDFSNKLKVLKRHDFIAKQQSAFFSEKKEMIRCNEAVIVCDFSENYSFVVQDEAQSFHWNKLMATVHPFVVYYKQNDVLKHKSFVFISECLKHDTVLVHAFQRVLLRFLKEDMMPHLVKIYYFSDGSAAQYKNRKNFANLCKHAIDFYGVEAEWHFYATAHGKGVCDGVGGTVKRLATKASLQNPVKDHIMTPEELFEWSVKNIPAIKFFYVENEEYHEEERLLEERFSETIAISGTQKYHAFLPLSPEKLQAKHCSASEKSVIHSMIMLDDDVDQVPFEQITGFVACLLDKQWWMGCVLSTEREEKEVTISFLHPAGPHVSFTYPQKLDVLTISASSILCKLDPRTPTGRTYILTQKEMDKANQILLKKLEAYNL